MCKCVEATVTAPRICKTDWQTLTIDTATANITKDEPIHTTAAVTFNDTFYSKGGTTRVIAVELEETCTGSDATNIVTPALNVLLFTGNAAPTAPAANTAYDPDLNALAANLVCLGTETTIANEQPQWTRVGDKKRRIHINADRMIFAGADSVASWGVFTISGTDDVTFTGKGTAIRARLIVELIS